MTRPSDLTRDSLQVILGGRRGADTSCGMVSLSISQTTDAVQTARLHMSQRGAAHLAELTNHDIVWLLVNGWDPRDAWTPWMESEPIAGSPAGLWPLVAVVLAVAIAVALLVVA